MNTTLWWGFWAYFYKRKTARFSPFFHTKNKNIQLWKKKIVWITVDNFSSFSKKNECLWINSLFSHKIAVFCIKNNTFPQRVKKLSTKKERVCGFMEGWFWCSYPPKSAYFFKKSLKNDKNWSFLQRNWKSYPQFLKAGGGQPPIYPQLSSKWWIWRL
jgi:hypothetical protein